MENKIHSFGESYFEQGIGTVFKDGYHEQPFLDYWKGAIEYLIQRCKPKRVLEIGCAKGFLIQELQKRGIEAYGVDISEYALSQANPGIKPFLKRCQVPEERIPYPDGFFDLVISLETVEHLHHPEMAIIEISRLLKPKGFVFITTPSPGTEAATADVTHISVRHWQDWKKCFQQNRIRLERIFPWVWSPEVGRLGRITEPMRTIIRRIYYLIRETFFQKSHLYLLGQKE